MHASQLALFNSLQAAFLPYKVHVVCPLHMSSCLKRVRIPPMCIMYNVLDMVSSLSIQSPATPLSSSLRAHLP